ncbi:GAF domain-containing protein [Rhodobacteraceae bacterium 2CG4]|uniref:histidine kinase n=2 Tax=Halovulum marinum TaxID=2662447 RepID=A0A6L5Z4X0_9RHOB|nr:GAF domain-containing protein [Halovulum marinum]
MGFTAIARVTEDRWITCSSKDDLGFGLGPGDELKVETTICNEIRASSEMVVIDDVRRSGIYCNHPTPAMYGFRSYISLPIRLPDGTFFGTLCAIDPEPRELSTPQITGLFRICADLIGSSIDTAMRLDRTEADLGSERGIAKLREEFIAVVGHDLRNPIAALASGLNILARRRRNDPEPMLHELQVVVHRMSALVENLVDFATGQLGGEISVDTGQAVDLRALVEDAVAEVALATGRSIEVGLDLPERVPGDRTKLGQMLSNLLVNAATHGDAERPIVVKGVTEPDVVRIDVINGGPTIPAAMLDGIFDPYVRGASVAAGGLGLGLHIAAQIARAHGGRIAVRSENDETSFSVRLPHRADG